MLLQTTGASLASLMCWLSTNWTVCTAGLLTYARASWTLQKSRPSPCSLMSRSAGTFRPCLWHCYRSLSRLPALFHMGPYLMKCTTFLIMFRGGPICCSSRRRHTCVRCFWLPTKARERQSRHITSLSSQTLLPFINYLSRLASSYNHSHPA